MRSEIAAEVRLREETQQALDEKTSALERLQHEYGEKDQAFAEAAAEIESLGGKLDEAARTLDTTRADLATLTTERREAESRYLEAAVGRAEAQATRTALESALANANAANARLAAMKPPPAPEPKPLAPPTPWEMDVERDGAGQIRRIVATPKEK